MATNINTLKNWFLTGLKPTQDQFWSWLDSYWHKDEKIPTSAIENIDTILNGKADKGTYEAHLTDANAHTDEFANKVNKIAGKGLSTVDFSTQDKEKLDDLDLSPYKNIGGFMVDVSGNEDNSIIEAGNIITGINAGGKYIIAEVKALPYTDAANLSYYLKQSKL